MRPRLSDGERRHRAGHRGLTLILLAKPQSPPITGYLFRIKSGFDGAFEELAAALLDLGFDAGVISTLMMAFMQFNFLANAVEAATEPAPVLRILPIDRVQYIGRPARASPCALAPRAALPVHDTDTAR